jgi:hypothetical protein
VQALILPQDVTELKECHPGMLGEIDFDRELPSGPGAAQAKASARRGWEDSKESDSRDIVLRAKKVAYGALVPHILDRLDP